MPTVTDVEYRQNIDLYRTLAQREPVVIVSHGREATVLISADEYQRLTRRRRRPFLIEELPEQDWQAIEQAYAALVDGDAAEK